MSNHTLTIGQLVTFHTPRGKHLSASKGTISAFHETAKGVWVEIMVPDEDGGSFVKTRPALIITA